MFRLRDLKNGLYQIHKKDGPAFEGTPFSIFEQAVKLGVRHEDLAMAAHSLKSKNHDYADFTDSGRLKLTSVNKK